MQEKVGEQGAAYIPMPKGRGFTPHFGNPQTALQKTANRYCSAYFPPSNFPV